MTTILVTMLNVLPIICLIFAFTLVRSQTEEPDILCDCGTGRQGKIVGGDEATPNEFPWQVALTYNGKFGCGGSLINERYVLTAAHCINGVSPTMMKAVIGVHNLTNPEEKGVSYHKIKTIKMHRGYSEIFLLNDIALLELEDEVVLTENRKPVCLPFERELYKGRNLTVSGWGYEKEDGRKISEALRKVTVKVLGNPQCRRNYFRLIMSTQICAGHEEGGRDACQGDSGGPLMVKNGNRWHIAGIVSYGYGCARKRYPGLYTRVNKFLNWIEYNTAGTKICSLKTSSPKRKLHISLNTNDYQLKLKFKKHLLV